MRLAFKCGEFEVETFTDGYPMWVSIRYREEKILHSLHHSEIKDLRYALDRLRNHIEAKLPESNKHEVR